MCIHPIVYYDHHVSLFVNFVSCTYTIYTYIFTVHEVCFIPLRLPCGHGALFVCN